MEARLNYATVSTEPVKAMFSLGAYLGRSGLEHNLQELLKVRVSQINGCAYCLDMHTKDVPTGFE